MDEAKCQEDFQSGPAGPGGLVLRRWKMDDAAALGQTLAENAEHLGPWMGWMEREPLSLDERKAMLHEWEQDWLRGGDVALGIFLDDQAVGSCGLHRRIAPDGLEIGYWIDSSFTGRGLRPAPQEC